MRLCPTCQIFILALLYLPPLNAVGMVKYCSTVIKNVFFSVVDTYDRIFYIKNIRMSYLTSQMTPTSNNLESYVLRLSTQYPVLRLMLKMPHSSQHHAHTLGITVFNAFLVFNRASRLYYR